MDKFIEINFNILSSTCKNRGCLIDSSTIIYIDKIFLLSILVENYKVNTTSGVLQEVLSNKVKHLNDIESLNLISVVNNITLEDFSKINNATIEKIDRRYISRLSTIDKLLLFSLIYLDLPIFTDDGIISKICKEYNYPYYNSLIIPILLYVDGLISDKEALNNIFKLNRIGRYSKEIFGLAFSWLEKTIKNNKI